jgi:hypothetical protein
MNFSLVLESFGVKAFGVRQSYSASFRGSGGAEALGGEAKEDL